MSESTTGAPAEGRPATQEEVELVAWAAEARRAGVDTLRDILWRLVTLEAALLGGAAALLPHAAAGAAAKVAAAACLLAALGCSLWGGLPHDADLNIHAPADVRAYRDRVYRSRWRMVWASSALVFAAFLAVFLGLAAAAGGPAR